MSTEIIRKSFDLSQCLCFYGDMTVKKKHVGPGKKTTTIYTDQTEHTLFKKRARSLDMSLSAYFRHLARKDLNEPGDLKVVAKRG